MVAAGPGQWWSILKRVELRDAIEERKPTSLGSAEMDGGALLEAGDTAQEQTQVPAHSRHVRSKQENLSSPLH